MEERRKASFRGELGVKGRVPNFLQSGQGKEMVRDTAGLNSTQLMHVSRSLGLYFKIWERTPAVYPPEWLLRRRLAKNLEYLRLDDALFRRDGGVEKLEGEEIKIAAEERGIDILEKKDEELLRHLKVWEKGAEEGRTLGMLLSR